jgi:SAM-dependent methyltransferase
VSEIAAQQLITGADYVKQITALESDQRARAAFVRLALEIAAPGANIFDFGAGPGMDARFYAQHGRSVAAYDVDANMCDYFAEHCRDLISTGQVKLEIGTYQEFLARHRSSTESGIDLVTSNFAPLNLIADLNELFAAFHAVTVPNGKVLASVLNPYYVGDMRYRWWWRNAPRLWRHGSFAVPGAQAPIVRRRLADFSARAAPFFKLERVFRGLPASRMPRMNGIDVRGGVGYTWTRLTTSRFLFLLFRKVDSQVLGSAK